MQGSAATLGALAQLKIYKFRSKHTNNNAAREMFKGGYRDEISRALQLQSLIIPTRKLKRGVGEITIQNRKPAHFYVHQ